MADTNVIEVRIPCTPLRAYQKPFFAAFQAMLRGETKVRTFCLPFARRLGKEYGCLEAIKLAGILRKGDYYYMLPSIKQARDIILNGMDVTAGVKKVDHHFPYPEVRTNEKYGDGIVHLRSGSRIIFGGIDDTRYRGGSISGLVISEAAFADIRPILGGTMESALLETDGWKIIQSTPNGRNTFYDLCEEAKANPATQFYQMVTAEDSGLYTEEQLEDLKQKIIVVEGSVERGTAIFLREQMCSFDVAGQLNIYSQEALNASKTRVYYDPEHPLYVALDLGFTDSTAAWFFQYYEGQWHFTDCHEEWSQTTEQNIQDILRLAPIKPTAILPHDAKAKRDNAVRTHAEIYRNHGFRVIQLESAPVIDGIQGVKRELPLMHFDELRCKAGLTALENYVWKAKIDGAAPSKPEHNQYSHFADALRYAVQAKQHVKSEAAEIPLQFQSPQRLVNYGRTHAWQ